MNKAINLVCPQCKAALAQSAQSFKCAKCGSVYPVIDGIPSFIIKKQDTFYEEYYRTGRGISWAKGHMGFKNAFLDLLLELRVKTSIVGIRQRFFESSFSKNRGSLILDLGCGGGYEFFTRYGNVTGVDMEAAPLKTARAVYARVIQADIGALPFEDNTFDYVVSSDVIEHIPAENKNRLLFEINRVLKPGGLTAHAIETDSANLLYRFAHKYPALFKKSFIEEAGGHFGLEMPEAVLKRFSQNRFTLIKAGKICGIVWPTEEYLKKLDNDYKEKSGVIKAIVILCRVLNKNMIVHGIANVLLGILNYFVEALTPLNHGAGVVILCKKSL